MVRAYREKMDLHSLTASKIFNKPYEYYLKSHFASLQKMGKDKKQGQILVGFALETNDELANAEKKLKSKNLDFIIMNSLKDKGAGFGTPTNKISILSPAGIIHRGTVKPKEEVA